MTLIVHQAAQREADDAVDWYEARSPGLGDQFLDAVNDVLRFIRIHPRTGRRISIARSSAEVRTRMVQRFPYKVVYQIIPTGAMVIAITHARRRPYNWQRRLLP